MTMPAKIPKLYPVNDETAIVKDITVNDPDENYGGHISLFRSIRKHWIWKDPVKLKWWIDVLLEVNHKDRKVLIGSQLVLCKRGECIVSILTWSKRWRTTRSSVRRFFALLESDSMIVLKSDTKTTHLTVCNYDSYQSWRPTVNTTNEHQTNNKVYTTNNYNNDNNNKGSKKLPFKEPTIEEVTAFIKGELDNHSKSEAIAQHFINFYGSKGWKVGKSKMSDWKAAVRNSFAWDKNQVLIKSETKESTKSVDMDEYLERPEVKLPY
jgi:hypothetical protein